MSKKETMIIITGAACHSDLPLAPNQVQPDILTPPTPKKTLKAEKSNFIAWSKKKNLKQNGEKTIIFLYQVVSYFHFQPFHIIISSPFIFLFPVLSFVQSSESFTRRRAWWDTLCFLTNLIAEHRNKYFFEINKQTQTVEK